MLNVIVQNVLTMSVIAPFLLKLPLVMDKHFAIKMLLLANDTYQWNEKKTIFLSELRWKKVEIKNVFEILYCCNVFIRIQQNCCVLSLTSF